VYMDQSWTSWPLLSLSLYCGQNQLDWHMFHTDLPLVRNYETWNLWSNFVRTHQRFQSRVHSSFLCRPQAAKADRPLPLQRVDTRAIKARNQCGRNATARAVGARMGMNSNVPLATPHRNRAQYWRSYMALERLTLLKERSDLFILACRHLQSDRPPDIPTQIYFFKLVRGRLWLSASQPRRALHWFDTLSVLCITSQTGRRLITRCIVRHGRGLSSAAASHQPW